MLSSNPSEPSFCRGRSYENAKEGKTMVVPREGEQRVIINPELIGRLSDQVADVLAESLQGDRQAQVLLQASAAWKREISSVLTALTLRLAHNFEVRVDYTRPLADMVAGGRYSEVDQKVSSEFFPVSEEGKADIEFMLVRFPSGTSGHDVIAELKMLGLRVATLPEMLAFAETYPVEVKRAYPVIVCLGSVAAAQARNPKSRSYGSLGTVFMQLGSRGNHELRINWVLPTQGYGRFWGEGSLSRNGSYFAAVRVPHIS